MDEDIPPEPPDKTAPRTPPFSPLPYPSDQHDTSSKPPTQFFNVVSNISQSEDVTSRVSVSRKRPVNDKSIINLPSKQLKSQISRENYNANDNGPFIVHVSRIESQPNAGTTLHPVSFGLFLFNNKITSVVKDGVKRVGRNRVSVEFATAHDANVFLINSILPSHKFVASIPSFHITRMGVVSGIPSDMSEEDICKYINVPPGCGKILKVRRINRKTSRDGILEWKPTETCVLTFDGQVLPKRVFCCYTSLPVNIYIFPTIQCRKCCRFGHVEAICRSNPRCSKCGQNHHSNTCEVQENEAFCVLCSGTHFASSRACPEFSRQSAIKKTMAEKNMSYNEACKSIPVATRSYADTLKIPQTQPIPPQSYRKTTFRQPKSRSPLSPSFDKVSHQDIISTPPSSQSNGCALKYSPLEHSLIDSLIQLLTSLLSSNIPCTMSSPSTQSPSNVANHLTNLLTLLKNGNQPSVPSMEREERIS